MEKLKKILSISTIVLTCVVSLLLILLLFGVDLFKDNNLPVFLSLGSLAVGGFFAINSLNMLNRNKIIAWISFGLIIGSIVLIILTAWIDFGTDVIGKITWALGLISVIFNIIVSTGLLLGKAYLPIQIVVYVIVAIVDIMAVLGIFGAIDLGDMLAVFLSLIILAVVGIVILKVLSKKKVSTISDVENDKDFVKISKAEYQMLLEKAKKYDKIESNK